MASGEQLGLEGLLAAREEIERALLRDHRARLAVLFTDIVGSTEYFERKGDVAGLAFVRRHNELLFPLVESCEGRIVKTIGDAIMAVFETPKNGLLCATQMQQRLASHRLEQPGLDPIHIRIGVHSGEVMLDGTDVFGDVVNTAARVESAARADEVLISADLLEASLASLSTDTAEPTEGSALPECVTAGALELKGKAVRVEVCAVIWGPEAPAPKMRSVASEGGLPASDASSAAEAMDIIKEDAQAPADLPSKLEALPPVLVLDLLAVERGLKVSVLEGERDKGPIRAYATQPFSAADVASMSQRFGAYLGGNARSYAPRVRALGEIFWRQALPESVRVRLETTEREFLRLHLDDSLADLPWELLHDGHAFLGLRFALGRVIATAESSALRSVDAAQQGTRALVISDPSADLSAAREEGRAVADLLHEGFGAEVKHLEGPLSRSQVLKELRGARLIHFAGHVKRHQGVFGLAMADGVIAAEELVAAGGGMAPSLVFANSCYSGGVGEWREQAERERGIASAMLLSGVRHYLGPTGPVRDTEALRFALRFWETLLAGERYGEAVRLAKLSLVENDPKGLDFARYQLYGEPRSRLPDNLARRVKAVTRSTQDRASLRGGSVGLDFAKPAAPWYRQRWVLGAFGAVLLGSLQFWVRHVWQKFDDQEAALQQTAADPVREQARLPRAPTAPEPPGVEQATPPSPAVEVKSLQGEGAIAISVLAFKAASPDPTLNFLSEGLAETIITDFGSNDAFRLIERVQVELQIEEIDFAQSKYVDPATRAKLGDIVGAELVVMGSYQSAGNQVRATARFVHVATGEILETLKVQGTRRDLFGLQDALALKVRGALPSLQAELR